MFVIYVMGSKEMEIVKALKLRGYTAYAPREMITERKKGTWHHIPRIVFPGYVFLKRDKITAEDYYTICKISGVGNFLSRNIPLSAVEEEYINDLCNSGKDIGISKGIRR